MKLILLVAIGGAVGSVARYKLGALVLHHTLAWKFPTGTFTVNVLGCLVAGLLLGFGGRYDFFNAEARLLLFTGFLGGFTTFSAFGIETVALIQRGDWAVATSYTVLSLVCGLVALWLMMKLAGIAGN